MGLHTLTKMPLRAYAVFLWITVMVFLLGCNSEGGYRRVDFNKVKSVPRADTSRPRDDTLRVAIGSMISPRATMSHYQRLLAYLGNRVNRQVELVQKKTYAEIDQLLDIGEIDVAFICSGPFAADSQKMGLRLLAAPEIQGKHLYHSYLIVNVNSPYGDLKDLKGKTFAFTDPDSNTGRLVPTFWLAELGHRPKEFFSQIIYTHAHDNSILAVARGLVDGASVDGLIWEHYREMDPALTANTRVIKKSQPFGIPPVVASRHLSPAISRAVNDALLTMHHNKSGREILAELRIDRFVAAQMEWYEPVRRMQAKLDLTR